MGGSTSFISSLMSGLRLLALGAGEILTVFDIVRIFLRNVSSRIFECDTHPEVVNKIKRGAFASLTFNLFNHKIGN